MGSAGQHTPPVAVTAAPVTAVAVPAAPVTILRGAGVDVDARRVARVLVGTCLLALAALSATLFVVGARKNAQITDLREHGVPVEVTVTRCLGLLGGSGSNDAGYACRGSFTIGGHRIERAIPGDTFLPPGATLRAIAAPDDPGLFSTAAAVASEHASWKVFILPATLLVLLLAALGVLVARSKRDGSPPARRLRPAR